mmetsp:Transcript_21261/g.50543  ORF Transcript_21261/g.50543 Transcript_21261/m.50543 type:complete len:432 (+) Transcript_21261:649-1944(+)
MQTLRIASAHLRPRLTASIPAMYVLMLVTVPSRLLLLLLLAPPAFSSSSSSSSPASSSKSPSLKKLIQPFVMKCHPDMARQHGLSDSARNVNLEAIQNLNSYVDGIDKLMRPTASKYPFPREGHTVDIEFVIPMDDPTPGETAATAAAKNTTSSNRFVVSTSRRKLELLAPPLDMPPSRVRKYATRQFLELLRISDVPVPTSLSLQDYYDDDDDENDVESLHGRGTTAHGRGPKQRRPVSAWEASRERFWRRHNQILDRGKLNRMYREALRDAQLHLRTRNWIRDNPKLRHELLANVLSKVQFVASISPLEKLVAYRRLLRFLDEHFDELRLEDSGRYWEEQVTLMLGEPRPYNTSPSALRKLHKRIKKKKLRHIETGYSFAVHHDNTVTVTIPIDFDDQELLQELLRNMRDFLQSKGTGLEGDLYSAMYT